MEILGRCLSALGDSSLIHRHPLWCWRGGAIARAALFALSRAAFSTGSPGPAPCPYSAQHVEAGFCELRQYSVLGGSHVLGARPPYSPKRLAWVLSEVRQPGRGRDGVGLERMASCLQAAPIAGGGQDD